MNFNRLFFILILVLFSSTSFGQTRKITGAFPIQNFDPKEYNGHSQNWEIIQDQRGVVYFANNNGVLEFDGKQFRTNIVPNCIVIRSLAVDHKGDFYYGGFDMLGCFRIDRNGYRKHYSFLKMIDTANLGFRDVWKTRYYQGNIYFFSTSRIFKYNIRKDTIDKIFKPEAGKSFHFPFYMDSTIYLFGNEKQLYKLDHDSLIFFPTIQKENFRRVVSAINMKNKTYLLSRQGICEFKNGEITKAKVKDKEIIEKQLPYSFNTINQNLFSLATSYNILLLDSNLNIRDEINEANNLQNTKVWYTFTDRNQVLWAALNNGISKIEINSPFTFWNKLLGLSGNCSDVIGFQNEVYIATEKGIYVLDSDNASISNLKRKFVQPGRLSEFKDLCWSFDTIYNNSLKKTILLAGTSTGLNKIENNEITQLVSMEHVYRVKVSKFISGRVYLGCHSGFYYIDLVNNIWTKPIKIEETKNDIVRFIKEEKNGTIWLSLSSNGLRRIVQTKNSNNQYDYKIEKVLNDSIFAKILEPGIFEYKNQFIFFANNGSYKYNQSKNLFEKSSLLGKEIETGRILPKYLQCDEAGNIWIYGNNLIKLIPRNEKWEIDSVSFKFPNSLMVNNLVNIHSYLWLAADDGLIRIDGSKQYIPQQFYCLIRKIVIGKDSLIYNGNSYIQLTEQNNLNMNNSEFPVINYKLNSIAFDFSSPYFIKQDKILYSYYLDGYSTDWSIWTSETKAVFTNLNEGDYKFQVKAKNYYGTESVIAEYKFSIKPPFYRTIYAYLFYIVTTVFVIYLIIKLYTRKLQNEKIHLEKLVLERTAEIMQQKEELLTQAEELQTQAEELQTQAEELERINKELEKLSIVASETTNVVLIMNNDTEIEWVNSAFEKSLGYKFEEYKKKFGTNFLLTSSNPQIKEIIQTCLNEKKSVNYFSSNLTKDNQTIWFQTTITPILNEKGEISKLVAIDSDISKLKEAEQEIIEKSKILEAQKDSIESSIRYAKTIQHAIFPPYDSYCNFFEIFALYLPKDIVSGDFYIYLKVQNNNSNLHFWAVADCTGHGVPGAFMSLIGTRLLNEIIIQRKIYDTSQILSELSNLIINSLNQKTSDNQDGMDICLVKFEDLEKPVHKLTFTGAKRPLYYFIPSENKVYALNSDRIRIGGIQIKNDKNFTNQELEFTSETIFYLSSDGFIDQPDEERKSFGSVRLIDFLKQIGQYSLEAQKEALYNRFISWKSNTQQRDDITILGLKCII